MYDFQSYYRHHRQQHHYSYVPQCLGSLRGDPGRSQFAQYKFSCTNCHRLSTSAGSGVAELPQSMGEKFSDPADMVQQANALLQVKFGKSLADYEDEGDMLYDTTGAKWTGRAPLLH